MINPKTGKRWKVFMGLPSNGTVCDFQSYMFRELADRYKDEVELVYPEQLCQRIFHDAARCGTVEDFLETDCDVLWFVDSDIVPPKHVLDLLTMHGDKWLCAGAPYPIFMAQPGETQRQVVITAYKSMADSADGKKRIAPCAVPDEGAEFVDGLATGCLMIKREVFDRLEKPYFEFKYDPITRQPLEGEDIGFCLKMLSLGIRFFTDYSMVCKHYKNNLDLLEINNYAVCLANKHIAPYKQEMDRVKAQLTEVATRFKRLKVDNDNLKKQLEAHPKQNKSGFIDLMGKPLIYR